MSFFLLGELYSKFVHILQKLFQTKKCTPKNTSNSVVTGNEYLHSLRDPLLDQKVFSYQIVTEKFFRPSINPVYIPIIKNSPEKLYTDEQICTTK